MIKYIDSLTLKAFSLFLSAKGFKLIVASTDKEIADAMSVRHKVHTIEKKWDYPSECDQWINEHYKTCTLFLTYYKSKPIATCAIFDPEKSNRLYEGFGINQNCEYFEIGGLAIIQSFRGGQMIALLSLYYQIYLYSRKHNIHRWIALSSRVFVRSMKQLTPGINQIDVNIENGTSMLGRLYHQAVIQLTPSIVCYTVDLNSISPWRIAKRLINYATKEVHHRLRFK